MPSADNIAARDHVGRYQARPRGDPRLRRPPAGADGVVIVNVVVGVDYGSIPCAVTTRHLDFAEIVVKNEAGVLSETHWPKKARKRVTILKNWLK